MSTPFLRAVGIVAGMFLLLAVLGACGTTPYTSSAGPTPTPAPPTATPKPPTATPAPSLAYQLARLDGSTDVASYQALLTSLANKTGDSLQTVSDDTVKGQQLLQQEGKTATLLELLTGADASVTKDEHMKYANVMAALVTVMEQN